MTLSNLDTKKIEFRDRLIRRYQTQRECSVDIKEISDEMKNNAGYDALEIAGIKLAAKRYLQAEAKKSKQTAVLQFALVFDDVPMGPERAGA